MKRYMHKLFTGLWLLTVFLLAGCEKDWLEEKRDLNTVLPKTLEDLTAILHAADAPLALSNDYAGAQLARDDDYYSLPTVLNSFGEIERKLYVWDISAVDALSTIAEWNSTYEQILYANVVLESLNKIERIAQNAEKWDNVRGAALFFRAKSHYNAARMFSRPFFLSHTTTPQGKGIPLRLSSDPNVASERASLPETYGQILNDLTEAVSLLSIKVPHLITPSKQAAFGLLARINLSIGAYDAAGRYADSCLQLYNVLLDYRDFKVSSDRDFPFPLLNDEVIFQSYLMPQYGVTTVSGGRVDSTLFDTYSNNDKRKALFFTSDGGFRGNYTGNSSRFSGIAVDEILLIRAESFARAGASDQALADLNKLLEKRIVDFVPYTNLTGDVLIDLILNERRKQLLYRGLRWDDLRRLNMEENRRNTIRRNIGGQQYELVPNDPKYALSIPQYIIANSKIEQNEW